jgi:hypothetical protein
MTPTPRSLHPLHGARVLALLLLAASARAASVSWDGPANGTWNTAANWSNDAVPTALDVVTIAGATVGVGDARTVQGLTLVDDGRLSVVGIGASLSVTGPVNVDNGQLVATNFGHIDLSTLTSVTRTRCAGSIPIVSFVTAQDGTVDLSGLQTITVNAPACPAFDLNVDVFGVGNVDLSGLQSTAAPAPHGVSFNVQGMIALGSLTTATNTSFNPLDTAAIALPSLTAWNGGESTIVMGTVTANALTQATGVRILTAHDDAVVMNALTTFSDGGLFLNAGRITLPSVTTFVDVSMQLLEGSTLEVPQLTTYRADKPGALLSGGILQAPALRSLVNVNLTVAEGTRTMNLPGVTSYAWTLCDGGGLGTILAGGGGTMDLSGVKTFTIDVPGCGPLGFNVGAVSGGTIDFSGLERIEIPGQQTLGVLAGGAGSVIDLSALISFPATKAFFFENDSGRIIRNGGGGGGGGDYDTVRGYLATLRAGVGELDRKASRKLGKLVTKAEKKLASAAAGAQAGKAKRVQRGLKQTRAALVRFVAQVGRLQSKGLDPLAAAALVTAAAQAIQEVEALQSAG